MCYNMQLMERVWKPVRRFAAASTLVVLGACAVVHEKEPVQPKPTIPALIDCAYEASPDGGKTTVIVDQCNAPEGDTLQTEAVPAAVIPSEITLQGIEPVVPLGDEVSVVAAATTEPGLSAKEVASDVMILTGASMIAIGGVMLAGQRRDY